MHWRERSQTNVCFRANLSLSLYLSSLSVPLPPSLSIYISPPFSLTQYLSLSFSLFILSLSLSLSLFLSLSISLQGWCCLLHDLRLPSKLRSDFSRITTRRYRLQLHWACWRSNVQRWRSLLSSNSRADHHLQCAGELLPRTERNESVSIGDHNTPFLRILKKWSELRGSRL